MIGSTSDSIVSELRVHPVAYGSGAFSREISEKWQDGHALNTVEDSL